MRREARAVETYKHNVSLALYGITEVLQVPALLQKTVVSVHVLMRLIMMRVVVWPLLFLAYTLRNNVCLESKISALCNVRHEKQENVARVGAVTFVHPISVRTTIALAVRFRMLKQDNT